MAARRALVVAGISARALAEAARRSGFLPYAADLFADTDLRRAAQRFAKIEGDPARGFEAGPFHAALEALFAAARAETGAPALGLVYGSGMEAAPEALLGPFRERILGNPPALVAALKDPERFARLAQSLGLPHPPLSPGPAPGPSWLVKRRGGAGGGHVRFAAPGERPEPSEYLQAFVPGRPVSALFLADGARARLLFFTEQFPDPAPAAPFRYGGAVRPARLAPEVEAAMAEGIARLVRATGLKGLNGADFLYAPPGQWVLLEINPRPGATLDLAPGPVLALHAAACQGRLPPPAPPPAGAAGAAVLYAPAPLRIPPHLAWPAWTRDRPPAGAALAAGEPLCTLCARGKGAEEVRARLAARRRTLLARLAAAGAFGAERGEEGAGEGRFPFAPLEEEGREGPNSPPSRGVSAP